VISFWIWKYFPIFVLRLWTRNLTFNYFRFTSSRSRGQQSIFLHQIRNNSRYCFSYTYGKLFNDVLTHAWSDLATVNVLLNHFRHALMIVTISSARGKRLYHFSILSVHTSLFSFNNQPTQRPQHRIHQTKLNIIVHSKISSNTPVDNVPYKLTRDVCRDRLK